jgi:hypothetical protein
MGLVEAPPTAAVTAAAAAAAAAAIVGATVCACAVPGSGRADKPSAAAADTIAPPAPTRPPVADVAPVGIRDRQLRLRWPSMTKQERGAALRATLVHSSDSEFDSDDAEGAEDGSEVPRALRPHTPKDGSLAIPRVAAGDISPEEFRAQYIDRALPVVLTGAMDSWPAFQRRGPAGGEGGERPSSRRWSVSSFRERFPETEVVVDAAGTKEQLPLGEYLGRFPRYRRQQRQRWAARERRRRRPQRQRQSREEEEGEPGHRANETARPEGGGGGGGGGCGGAAAAATAAASSPSSSSASSSSGGGGNGDSAAAPVPAAAAPVPAAAATSGARNPIGPGGSGSAAAAAAQPYLRTWYFADALPELVEEFSTPPHFADDAFRRLPADMVPPFQWLFFGPQGTESKLCAAGRFHPLWRSTQAEISLRPAPVPVTRC